MRTGEVLTHATAVTAFVFYVAGVALRWVGSLAWSRWCWTLGCLVLVIHVGCAFEFVHHWSHQAALEATARQTAELTGINSGGGLWLNYLLVVIWLADVAYSWMARQSYESRAKWVEWAVQGFLGFMWFNATVVFGHGPSRWLGLAAMGLLVVVGWRRRSRFGVPPIPAD